MAPAHAQTTNANMFATAAIILQKLRTRANKTPPTIAVRPDINAARNSPTGHRERVQMTANASFLSAKEIITYIKMETHVKPIQSPHAARMTSPVRQYPTAAIHVFQENVNSAANPTTTCHQTKKSVILTAKQNAAIHESIARIRMAGKTANASMAVAWRQAVIITITSAAAIV